MVQQDFAFGQSSFFEVSQFEVTSVEPLEYLLNSRLDLLLASELFSFLEVSE